MKYQLRHVGNLLQISTDQQLIRESLLSFKESGYDEQKFRKGAVDADGLISFCQAVGELDGMEEKLSFYRYQIQMYKASLFSWDDLLPHILDSLRTLVAKGQILEEVIPAQCPPLEKSEAPQDERVEL